MPLLLFYFEEETNKKAVGSVGHVRTLLNQRSMLFKGNSIASFTRLKKRSMLFKGKFYFNKETIKKAV